MIEYLYELYEMNNKKPSGFQFRQQKKRKEEKSKKLSGSLAKFLKTTNNFIPSTNSSVTSTSCAVSFISLDLIPSTSTAKVSKALPNSISSPTLIHINDGNNDIDIDVDNSSRLVRIDQFEDPGLWPDIIYDNFSRFSDSDD